MVKILIKIENINLNIVFLQVINDYSNQILSPTEERLGRAGDSHCFILFLFSKDNLNIQLEIFFH